MYSRVYTGQGTPGRVGRRVYIGQGTPGRVGRRWCTQGNLGPVPTLGTPLYPGLSSSLRPPRRPAPWPSSRRGYLPGASLVALLLLWDTSGTPLGHPGKSGIKPGPPSGHPGKPGIGPVSPSGHPGKPGIGPRKPRNDGIGSESGPRKPRNDGIGPEDGPGSPGRTESGPVTPSGSQNRARLHPREAVIRARVSKSVIKVTESR